MTDQRRAHRDATIASYQAGAEAYRAAVESGPRSPLADEHDRYAALLPAGAQVLEIGSGTGKDARELEALGLSVRRTDITAESTTGPVPGSPFFAFWQADPLRALINDSGWYVEQLDRYPSPRGGHWLSVHAARAVPERGAAPGS